MARASTVQTGLRTPAVDRWSPARLYLVISGVVLLALAVIGFAYSRSFPTDPGAVPGGAREVFGVLLTNGWHNLAGLLSGVVALGFAVKPGWARTGALLKGAFYVAVTTSLAVLDGETVLASNWADQIVHASLAVGGIATGLATPRSRADRPPRGGRSPR